ncbi:hypothetical protein [Fusibacter ferrireducens]|uniref:Uncharacterized protein n=1 Tax=Fusibacter ferrireducens TaxID=2785058 RepID=A0ABR9ZXI5_9FIRM|nr:hypothetical protein [Fusibacter ferrireducens]MBF4695076.1 hypothetical protein [Fusibacter ferrireducens]
MLITRHNLPKGSKAIIVGDMMSKILLSSAKILADEQVSIDTLTIEDTDDVLYLCGHGNKDNKTIGKRSMKEIAELLVNAGYKGFQPIYVTSCDSYGMLRLLDFHLQVLLQDAGEMTLDNIDNTNLEYVSGNADGSTVTLKEGDENVLYVLKAEGIVDKTIINLSMLKQSIFHEKSEHVDRYKRKLISKEYHLGQFTTVSSVVAVFLAFVLLSIVLVAQFLTGFTVVYKSVVLGSIIVLVILDMITRRLTKGTIDTAVHRYNLDKLIGLTVIRYFVYMYLLIISTGVIKNV